MGIEVLLWFRVVNLFEWLIIVFFVIGKVGLRLRFSVKWSFGVMVFMIIEVMVLLLRVIVLLLLKMILLVIGVVGCSCCLGLILK